MLARIVYETFWLNVTNGALGIATAILLITVGRAICLELRLRHRKRP